MSLYIVSRQGPGGSKLWISGDPGQPNHADSKQELLSFCPMPDPVACPNAECSETGFILPKSSRGNWQWVKMKFCRRCQSLYNHHGMTLAELISLWEEQDRSCYLCRKALSDPRFIRHIRAGGRNSHIDHNHKICPQQFHSCKKCRRGLACVSCNTHSLALRTVGFWMLPEEPVKVNRWLKFLGPEDRKRLRLALESFPEGQ